MGDKMILTYLGNNIKNQREKHGLSQQELSDITGIVREQISRIETGQVNITMITLDRIAKALETSLEELVKASKINKQKDIEFNIKPFIKWAGGKTQLISRLIEFMPDEYNDYYEPFVGGGALLFDTKPSKAILNDVNEELILAYKCFQNESDFERMVKEIQKHEQNHSEEYYYEIRNLDRTEAFTGFEVYERAARMIYLNKACFNGLYRVNSKGYFNVPSGKKDKVKAYDFDLFEALKDYLSSNDISFLNGDFEDAVRTAKYNDFVYFDPPYDTFEEQKNFTAYSKGDFGPEEQIRLANVFKELSSKGVKVMLSNHNTKLINELYQGFNINVVPAKRMINSKGNGRGSVEEVIITNY
jgi:DNA adenine methylase